MLPSHRSPDGTSVLPRCLQMSNDTANSETKAASGLFLTFALQGVLEGRAYHTSLRGDLNLPHGSLGSQRREAASPFLDLGLHGDLGRPVCLPEVLYVDDHLLICIFPKKSMEQL